jgi:hypothetical protein
MDMEQRIHRSIRRRAKTVNPTRIADCAEDYLEGHKLFKRDIEGIKGLATPLSIKNGIKRIDKLEKEIIIYENRIERLEERRAIEAAKLEQELKYNNSVLKQYFDHSEMKEFWR